MTRTAFFALPFLLLCAAGPAPAESTDRAVHEAEIAADVASVWRAFTTPEGLRSWMAPLADIELTVGGKMRANYNAEGELGDETTIVNTILAFDPERMLSLKATGFPKGFPYEEVARETWSVFYFESAGPERTKITIAGLGYTDDPKSQEMRSTFAAANAWSLQQLEKALTDARTASDQR